MGAFKTKEILGYQQHIIEWNNTGEVIDRVDCHDWTEKAEGVDQLGYKWEGHAVMSMGEIESIEDTEIL